MARGTAIALTIVVLLWASAEAIPSGDQEVHRRLPSVTSTTREHHHSTGGTEARTLVGDERLAVNRKHMDSEPKLNLSERGWGSAVGRAAGSTEGSVAGVIAIIIIIAIIWYCAYKRKQTASG